MSKIQNYIACRLADADNFAIESGIPAEQIAIFSDNLFFIWEKEIAQCAEAVREVLKAEGKRYFVIACHSTYLMEDMRHIIESGLAKMATHALVYSKRFTFRTGKCEKVLEPEGAAVVFEII